MSTQFFYSTPFANYQDTNFEHDLDIDRLLATPIIGLETARVIKKWRKRVASATQRLANARAKYAATPSTEAASEFSRLSIEFVSIPTTLHNAIQFATATDKTRAKRAELRRVYAELALNAYNKYIEEFYRIQSPSRLLSSDDEAYPLLDKAHQAYLAECDDIRARYLDEKLDAFVIAKTIF
jgi:hypothetical protein